MAGRPTTTPSDSFPEGYTPPRDGLPDPSRLDHENPRSLINLVDGSLKEAILRIPEKYLQMTERGLKKVLKPKETICRLRLAFWDEFNRSLENATQMKVDRIIRGVCTKEHFYSVVLLDPKMLAWVVTPPLDHMIAQRELLDLATSRLRDIVKAPIVITETKRFPNGTEIVTKKANPAVMGQVMKAFELLSDRVYGAVIQRQQNVNLNLGPAPKTEAISIESIEAEEAAVRKQIAAAQGADVIEATVEEVSE